MEQTHPRGPGVRVPPPLWVALVVAGGLVLERVVSLPDFSGRATRVVAAGLLAAWLLLLVLSLRELRRSGTTVRPDRPASALVTSGPYAKTRNPLYLGLTLLQAAAGLWFGSLWVLLLIPVTVVLLTRFAILPEERYLEATFGEAYRQYRSRVRRWL
jgi:protein-S-isoprenylcysteine O-methyltransferase Ste14